MYDNVGIIQKLKDIRLNIRHVQTKHNRATMNRVTVLQIYHKTIVANKIYYKRQVYAARASLYRQDLAKGKTLVALVLDSL